MTHQPPARTAARRTPSAVLLALAVIGAVLIGAPASQLLMTPGGADAAASPGPPGVGIGLEQRPTDPPARRGRQTVFEEELDAAVANLDPDLLRALRRAAADAARDGVELVVNSGWRSAEHQADLLRDAIDEHGSEEEAARWVATPETSAHVSGDAVDIGPADAAAWLSEHGSDHGLCQIYENEPWHYELRPAAVDDGCPAMYANPTHDPRMQR